MAGKVARAAGQVRLSVSEVSGIDLVIGVPPEHNEERLIPYAPKPLRTAEAKPKQHVFVVKLKIDEPSLCFCAQLFYGRLMVSSPIGQHILPLE